MTIFCLSLLRLRHKNHKYRSLFTMTKRLFKQKTDKLPSVSYCLVRAQFLPTIKRFGSYYFLFAVLVPPNGGNM